MTVKLGDLGLSRQLIAGDNQNEQSELQNVTIIGLVLLKHRSIMQVIVRYMALESLLHETHSIESEVWTFGIIVWELFTFAQNLPYERELSTHFSIATLTNYLISGHRLRPPTDTMPHSMYK
jgi:serine/threonine protein kinase